MSANEPPPFNEPSAAPNLNWNPWATEQVKRIEPTADLIGKVVKIGASLASIPTALGGLLLTSYIHSAGAPLPPLDASSGLFLIILALVCVIALTIVVAYFIFPFFQKEADAKIVSRVLPSLYVRNPSGGQWFSFVKAYAFLFLPMFLCLAIAVIYSFESGKWIKAHLQGAIWSAWLLGVLSQCILSLRKHLALKDLWHFIAASLGANLFSSTWILTIFLCQLVILERTWTGADELLAYGVLFLCLTALLVVHFLLYSRKLTLFLASIFWFILSCFALFIFPGTSFLGGMALRYLGDGGTVPVSLTLKGSNGENSRPVRGCLIIAVANQVSISVDDSSKGDDHPDCRLEPRSFNSQSARREQSVKTYQRADILDLESRPEISTPAKK